MYRTLGIPEDSSRETVARAAARLKKKYAGNEAALERVETANLWVLTKMVARKEEALRQRQQASRLREFGDSPRRLFQKYVAGYIPPNIRQMMEVPSTKHFRWVSGLLGACALLGLCTPTQASNFVGLAAAATLGFVYQRDRPEPVKDEFGNAGAVKKINPKEMGATIALVAVGAALGSVLSFGIAYLADAPFQTAFLMTTILTLWMISLFFKVHGCFDQ